MTEIQHLAKLAYQNGDKALQWGWWDYVQAEAAKALASHRKICWLKSKN